MVLSKWVKHGIPCYRSTKVVWFMLLLVMAQRSAGWKGKDQDTSFKNHDNESVVALSSDGVEQDIHNDLTVLNESKDSSNRFDSSSVHEQPAAIAHTTAIMGKLFSYTLPKVTMKGEVTEYKVTETNKSSLPTWLVYNATTSTLAGVPGQDELGQQYLIQVTALSHIPEDAMSHTMDIVTISVAEDNTHLSSLATPLKDTSGGGMTPIRCLDGSPITMITIMIDVSLESMLAQDRLALMHGMGSHLSIPTMWLKVMPFGKKSVWESAELLAGRGDVKKTEPTGAVMQWKVGCGNINDNHTPIVQRVRSTSLDGSMSKAVAHNIIGWHVTNNWPYAPQRMKRAVKIAPSPAPESTTGPPTKPPMENFNYPPLLRNGIGRIVVTAGDVLHFKVPKDTFYDFEDGNTENLTLYFMSINGLTLPPYWWVQFNATSQILYGLPLPTQDEGSVDYIMAAIDQNGKIGRDMFQIDVKRRPQEQKINHEFSLILDTDYGDFINHLYHRLEVASKLAKLYGDPDSSKMTVTEIAQRTKTGPVVYVWMNNTVAPSPCPLHQIEELLRYLVNDNGTLKQMLVETIKPYRILKAGVEHRGVCASQTEPLVTTEPPVTTSAGPVEQTPRGTTILLLVATCIACIIHCQK